MGVAQLAILAEAGGQNRYKAPPIFMESIDCDQALEAPRFIPAARPIRYRADNASTEGRNKLSFSRERRSQGVITLPTPLFEGGSYALYLASLI